LIHQSRFLRKTFPIGEDLAGSSKVVNLSTPRLVKNRNFAMIFVTLSSVKILIPPWVSTIIYSCDSVRRGQDGKGTSKSSSESDTSFSNTFAILATASSTAIELRTKLDRRS